MTLSHYQKKCIPLAVYPKNNYLYTFLGLLGEFGEFYDKVENITTHDSSSIEEKKELGDVLWYYVMMCYELKIDLDTEDYYFVQWDVIIRNNLESVFSNISKLSEIFKKVIRDNTEINKRQVEEFMYSILTTLYEYTLYRNWDLEEILQMNIDKLKDRQNRNVLHGSGDNR